MTTPLPAGFRVEFDRDTQRIDDRTLFGGAPARVLRLSATGQDALGEILAGPIHSATAGTLGRRLIDTGLAHPVPPPAPALTVTVLIPVRDRAAGLDRCLAALDGDYPVVVVDDGSTDPAAIARVCAEHGARLVRRAENGGPAAARNQGLALLDSEIVAFLDSDCVPTPGWINRLADHLADPLVAVAAPRIVPIGARGGALGRYNRARGCLDLGGRRARVAPATWVAYVPTAALLARVAALRDVTIEGAVFDEALRYGEDVDLVWRLHARGWRMRYDPSVLIAHDEPASWPALLARRFRYGTSAAPLSARHPAEIVPVVVPRWPGLAVLALVAGRPGAAAVAFTAGVLATRRSVRRARLPETGLLPNAARTVGQVGLGLGRYLAQFAGPAVAVAVLNRRLPRTGRAALLAFTLAPALRSVADVRPRHRAGSQLIAYLADDAAYGAGVWAGCVRHRTLRPLLPKF